MEPVDKNFVVAVDISASLSSIVPGTSVSTAVAAATVTMVQKYCAVLLWMPKLNIKTTISFFSFLQVFATTEANTQVLAYSDGSLIPCSVAAGMTLEQVTAELVKVMTTKKMHFHVQYI